MRKDLRLFCSIFSLIFVLVGCTAEDGVNGTNGINGTNGVNGTNASTTGQERHIFL
jgi:hypothetical protein